MWAFYGDPEAMRYIGFGEPAPRNVMDEIMEKQLQRYQDWGFGLWGVERKSDGAVMGRCGLILWDDVEGEQRLEVGYGYAPAYWGQGYGTEAARASRDWGFLNTDWPQLVSFILHDNIGSIRVAGNNGMTYQRDVDFHGKRPKNVSHHPRGVGVSPCCAADSR